MKNLNYDPELNQILIKTTQASLTTLQKNGTYELKQILSPIWDSLDNSEHKFIGRNYKKLILSKKIPELTFYGKTLENHNLYYYS